MVAWNDVFAMPEFWETYYENHVSIDDEPLEDEADDEEFSDDVLGPEDVLTRLFPPTSRPASDAWNGLDLYGFDAAAVQSRLRMLTRHNNDVALAVEAAASPIGNHADRERLAEQFREALAHEHTVAPPKTIDLTFADGTIWRIRFTTGPSETHLLVEQGNELIVGWTGAHFATPILRVDEVEAMCRTIAASGQAPFEMAWLPMLLHPAAIVTADDDVERHRAWIDEAWQRVEIAGKRLDDARRAELVERTTRPLDEYRWRRDPKLGWTNDFPHSHRNPRGGWPSTELGERFVAEGFDRIERFAVRCLDLPAVALRSV